MVGKHQKQPKRDLLGTIAKVIDIAVGSLEIISMVYKFLKG